MTAGGPELYIADSSGSVTEMDASTGAVRLALAKPNYELSGALDLALEGQRLFVASSHGWVAGVDLGSRGLAWRAPGSAYQFRGPEGMAWYGQRLFVASAANNRVVELNATTGALTRVLSGRQYDFDHPSALAMVGKDLFVASAGHEAFDEANDQAYQAGSDLTKVDSVTEEVVRVLRDVSFNASPSGMAVFGQDLFLAQEPSPTVLEVGTSSGAVVRTLEGTCSINYSENALAVVGNDLFVASSGPLTSSGMPQANGSLREVDARTGALVRVISGPTYWFYEPVAMAVAGTDIFVANLRGDAVTEVDSSAGTLLRVLSEPQFDWQSPDAIAIRGSDLYVASGYTPNGVNTTRADGGSVTQVDASSGAVRAVLSGPQCQWAGPCYMAATVTGTFVANNYGDSLTELKGSG